MDIMKKSWIPKEGGNEDKLYWLDGRTYKLLDESSWGAIEAGRAKL